MSRTIQIYDAIAINRHGASAQRSADPDLRAVRRQPQLPASVTGIVGLGEVALMVGGSRDDRSAFAFHLALDTASAGYPCDGHLGVRIVSCHRDAASIARWLTHALARLPLCSSTQDVENARADVSQLPIWIDEDAEIELAGVVAQLTRGSLPVTPVLCILDDLEPLVRRGETASNVVNAMQDVASQLPAAIVVLGEVADQARAEVLIELVRRDDALRAIVHRLLPLRRAWWPGFEPMPDSDEEFIREPFRDGEERLKC